MRLALAACVLASCGDETQPDIETPLLRLCGRALRTTMLYGAFPPESTSSVATPSM